jgi:hypothetical protein
VTQPPDHWTDSFQGYDVPAVRPYTITGGRVAPARDDLTMITLITVVQQSSPPRGLQPEHRTIINRCQTPAAVAEISADLNLPVSVTKILIGDLIDLGQVTARPPIAIAQASGAPEMTLLQAVMDGLRKL